ncbi:M48 family metallopeptidase [Psychrobacter sp. 1Y11]|uniref:M48 family metallopeptidase n=1 Tax=Psychrobacter sp. 1Y11 TaxID=3457446 RepID=UPI003FD59257
MPSQNLAAKNMNMTPLLQSAIERLAAANIKLQISKKRVKNINFRLKPNLLTVSVPTSISTTQMAQFIDRRVSWALAHHQQVLENYQRKQNQHPQSNSVKKAEPLWLWGDKQTFTLNHDKKIALYRQQLLQVMPELFEKWQPIVGTKATETRIKKMHTRWGSCNMRVGRVWLSVYLPAYPIECTEYVIVHELCHLHHANHSSAFWQTVETAMPEYKQWHDKLAGKDGKLD